MEKLEKVLTFAGLHDSIWLINLIKLILNQ